MHLGRTAISRRPGPEPGQLCTAFLPVTQKPHSWQAEDVSTAACAEQEAYLAWALLGEGNGEHAEQVAVCSLHIHLGLNERLPLAHQRPQLICCEVHTLRVS